MQKPGCSSSKKNGDPNDEWFKRRFGATIQQKERKEANKNGNKSYEEVRGSLIKLLKTRRHEDMERRYSFYNAENEIFDGPKEGEEEEEEEELMDEEEEEREDENDGMGDEERAENDDGTGPTKNRSKIGEDEEYEEEADDKNEDEQENEEEMDGERMEDEHQFSDEEDGEVGEDQEGGVESSHYGESEEEKSRNSEEDEEEAYENPVKKRRIIEEDEEEEEQLAGTKMMESEAVEANSPKNCQMETSDGILQGLEETSKREDLFTVDDEVEEDGERQESMEEEEEGAEDEDKTELDSFVEEANEMEMNFVGKVKPERRMKELLDDEASLSGDDVGSDPDEDQADGLDEYEAEEGDLDQLPGDEEIRDNLVRQYLKHQKDADDRKLLKLQEAFFADSDLHGKGGAGDRSFRLRMHDDSKVDWAKILGKFGEDGEEEEEDAEGMNNWQERRLEMLKLKLEEERKRRRREAGKKEEEDEELDDLQFGEGRKDKMAAEDGFEDLLGEELEAGELFKLGEEVLLVDGGDERGTSTEQLTGKESVAPSAHPAGTSIPIPPLPKRDSLLAKANCLESLVKDEKNVQAAKGGLIVSKKKPTLKQKKLTIG